MWDTDSVASFLTNELKKLRIHTQERSALPLFCAKEPGTGKNEEKWCTYRVKNINYGVGNAVRSM